jgi:hypothetical protein
VSQPLVDGRDEDGRLIADRELVVSRGHGTMPFETIDATFNRVPSPACQGEETGQGAGNGLQASDGTWTA